MKHIALLLAFLVTLSAQEWNTYEGFEVSTDKDIVLTPEEIAQAKEALSRIKESIFYRLGRYLGNKLGSQATK